MLLIPDRLAAGLIDFDEVLECVATAFSELDHGTSKLFDVVRGHASNPENFFAIKSATSAAGACFGIKVGTYFPALRDRGMAAHNSTVFLFDDETGRPLAAIGASSLNGMRTSAANALATRFLARPDASTLGLVGSGHQAVFEARAVASVRPISRILFWSPSGRSKDRFAEAVRDATGIHPQPADLPVLCKCADVLVTVTPSRNALIEKSWIRAGTHIAAMGADSDGKQELDPALVAAAKVYVDVAAQAATIGECQHACRLGLIDAAALESRTLGRLLNGKVSGRERDDEVTIFDSSGMALQDVAVAHRVYLRALNRTDLTAVELF